MERKINYRKLWSFMGNKVSYKRIWANITAAVSGFTPADLPGIVSWYKSDTGITIDTGVSVWANQAGFLDPSDLLQATTSKQPTLVAGQLNGYPCVRFDGVNDFMRTPFMTSVIQPNTVFIVFKLVNYVVDKTIFDATNTFGSTVRTHTGTPNLGQFAGSYIDNANFTNNTYCLMTSIFDGANSKLQINSNAETVGNCGAGNLEGITLAARPDDADYSQIDVVEVIIMMSAATDAERNNVKVYINNRYGI